MKTEDQGDTEETQQGQILRGETIYNSRQCPMKTTGQTKIQRDAANDKIVQKDNTIFY